MFINRYKAWAKRNFPQLYQWMRASYVRGIRQFNGLVESNYRLYYIRGWLTNFRRERERMAKTIGYYPSIEEPETIAEKVLWKKLYVRDALLTKTADKYAVREYIRERLEREVIDELLIPLLHVTDKPSMLPLEDLKPPYVIKANHGSGFNLFIHKRNGEGRFLVSTENESIWEESRKGIVQTCRKWLDTTYGLKRYEWCYLNINPKIVVEPFYDDDLGGNILTGYKVFCFHGDDYYVLVTKYTEEGIKINIYDENNNFLNVRYRKYDNFDGVKLSTNKIKKIRKHASTLSEPFNFARIDFYITKKGVKFSEITHYPTSGDIFMRPKYFEEEIVKEWDVYSE